MLFAWIVGSAFGGEVFDNVAIGDYDGDGEADVAIGIEGRCGAIEVWLSSHDPALGRPDRVDPDGSTPFTPGALWIEPTSCDPLFGQQVVTTQTSSGDRIATRLDREGRGTTEVVLDGIGGASLVVTGVAGPGCGSACMSCEPCCGPKPCCDTGGGGGGGGSHEKWIEVESWAW